MNPRKITEGALALFHTWLLGEEKSPATVEKYLRDARHFAAFAGESEVDKPLILRYKEELGRSYAVASANSMIASLNSFLRVLGWHDLCVRQLRVQRQAYTSEDKELTREEYLRLVSAAGRQGSRRLCLILQTICATGIRVSELQFITAESLQRGEAIVRCKGKTRTVFLVRGLCAQLRRYAQECGVASGPVFITRGGKPIGRIAVWRAMKALCAQANVLPGKVFPHNLRHLFARTFYGIEKDIAKLADILGHASINTTRIYIVTTGAEHRKKMESMHLVI